MSEGTLDRNTFETIEAYVLDRMSHTERSDFEQRMAVDPALRAEVEMERENIHAVELGGMRRLLKEIAAEEGTGRASMWSQFLKYAAVAATIVTIGTWWLLREPVNEALFAEHFIVDPGLPVTMGATATPAFTDGMVHYKQGHYSEAVLAWQALLQQAPTNDTLCFYLGAAALAQDDARAAVPSLAMVAEQGSSTFNPKARWFLFLAYLRLGDRTAAERVVFPDGSHDKQRAADILMAWPG